MAVPYRRKSRSQSRMQRAANMKYTTRQAGKCEHCGSPKIPHFACAMCGVYRGRQVRPAPEE
jgi:large subunit ribosomal protein L32